MSINLLADCMMTISYHGTASLATVAYDADGGTNSEGLFTFTVDGTATTVAVDSYATLATLVAAISAKAGWMAKPTPGLLSSMSTEYTTGLGQRVTSDMATTTVDANGVSAMIFTNAYEIMPASVTTALISSVPVPLDYAESCAISLYVDGADAGATGNATFNIVNNHIGAPNSLPGVFPATAYESGFDTLPAFGSGITVAINGATAVRSSTVKDCSGLNHLKILSVGNADDAVVNVSGSIELL